MEVNGTVLRCGWSRGTYVAVHGCGVGAAGDACVGWAAGVAVCGGLSQLGLVTCVEGGRTRLRIGSSGIRVSFRRG